MRTLPVALAYPERRLLLRQAARVSAMTHWDPRAEACCGVYCLWIAELLGGASLREGWRRAVADGRRWTEDWIAFDAAPPRAEVARGGRKLRQSHDADTPGLAALDHDFWDLLAAFPDRPFEQLQPTGYAGFAVHCLEAAVRVACHAVDSESALIEIVNLAGEADTMAAVAGGALGAAFGSQRLPARWLDLLHQRERLAKVAAELARLRHRRVYATPGLPPFAFYPVEPGLYAGRQPLTSEDVTQLVALGVTTVVDLREDHEWRGDERYGREAVAAAERFGIERINLAIADTEGPSAENLDRASALLAERISPPASAIYVHCRAGRERTGAVLVAARARRDGTAFGGALARLRESGCPIAPLPAQQRAVERWLGR